MFSQRNPIIFMGKTEGKDFCVSGKKVGNLGATREIVFVQISKPAIASFNRWCEILR